MKKKATQWQRLYTFECKGCGRPKAQTVKYRVMVDKNCKICRRVEIDRRQPTLFGDMQIVTDPTMPPGAWEAHGGSGGHPTVIRSNPPVLEDVSPKGADDVFSLPTEPSYTP